MKNCLFLSILIHRVLVHASFQLRQNSIIRLGKSYRAPGRCVLHVHIIGERNSIMARTLENLLGDHVIRQNGDKVQINTLCGKERVIGIYFSADWCPPCKGFTPKLVEFYNKLKAAEQSVKFEIVFVSWDKDENAFTEYFATMPWLALPFGVNRKVS